MSQEVAHTLIKARELLSDPTRWAKGNYAYDKDGVPTWEGGEDAVCFCAMGAINRLADTSADACESFKALCQALAAMGDNRFIPSFNDDEATTHADILNLFDRTIENVTSN